MRVHRCPFGPRPATMCLYWCARAKVYSCGVTCAATGVVTGVVTGDEKPAHDAPEHLHHLQLTEAPLGCNRRAPAPPPLDAAWPLGRPTLDRRWGLLGYTLYNYAVP